MLVHRMPDANIVDVRCNNTDVLVVLIYHIASMTDFSKVWMEVSLRSRNNHRYINVPHIISELDDTVVQVLPVSMLSQGVCTASCMSKG